MTRIDTFFWGFMTGLFSTVIIMGLNHDQESSKDGAVAAGHAEYYLDDKHERQWRWKPMPTPEPAK